MIVTWTGPAARIRRVRIGGTTVRDYGVGCGAGGALNGVVFFTTAAYTYNCNTNQNVDIRFCTNNNTATDVTVQLGGTGVAGPFDGQLTGLPLATWP